MDLLNVAAIWVIWNVAMPIGLVLVVLFAFFIAVLLSKK